LKAEIDDNFSKRGKTFSINAPSNNFSLLHCASLNHLFFHWKKVIENGYYEKNPKAFLLLRKYIGSCTKQSAQTN
jgi:hypothetical protein